jgi:threonine dehydratase
MLRPQLLVKAESLQPTGAFKLRGAYAAISALSPERRSAGVVTHSSGNHGAAVAYAAAVLGVPATVVVPKNAPAVKVAAARASGATIVECEPNLASRTGTVRQLATAHGYTEIPPYDHRDVIAGQGTVGLEIAADYPEVDLVVCPVAGGGLISGVAVAIKARNPSAKVIGVEPEFAADARDSLRAGHPVAWQAAQTARTIADALRIEQVGELPGAMRQLATGARLVAEPGGSVAVAACLFRSGELPKATHPVAILSGGNVDPAMLARALTTEMKTDAETEPVNESAIAVGD